jgi:hypothetical protein
MSATCNWNESDSATILESVTMPEDGRVRPKHTVEECTYDRRIKTLHLASENIYLFKISVSML